MTEKQIQDLMIKKKSSKLKGFTEHPQSLSEGILRVTDDFNIELKAD